MIFKLDHKDHEKISTWYKGIQKKALEEQKEMFTSEEYDFYTQNGECPYPGTIGGEFTYSFTPTSLGLIKKVKEEITGEELDLTEYDEW